MVPAEAAELRRVPDGRPMSDGSTDLNPGYSLRRAEKMLADLPIGDRLAEKARDGRGLAVIWEIPNKEDEQQDRMEHVALVLYSG